MKNCKKEVICALSLLLLMPGCWKKNQHKQPQDTKKTVQKEIDIPVANDAIKNFFEEGEELSDFLLDDAEMASMQKAATHDNLIQQVDTTGDVSEFAWAQEQQESDETFKTVYFDFDGAGIRDDQKDVVGFDLELAKRKIAECSDHQVTIVIDGHACHSAGNSTYNLAKSEQRACAVRDFLVARGIPKENIKTVGRGHESPAMVDSKKVTGNRQEQWLNRRAEVRIIHA